MKRFSTYLLSLKTIRALPEKQRTTNEQTNKKVIPKERRKERCYIFITYSSETDRQNQKRSEKLYSIQLFTREKNTEWFFFIFHICHFFPAICFQQFNWSFSVSFEFRIIPFVFLFVRIPSHRRSSLTFLHVFCVCVCSCFVMQFVSFFCSFFSFLFFIDVKVKCLQTVFLLLLFCRLFRAILKARWMNVKCCKVFGYRYTT